MRQVVYDNRKGKLEAVETPPPQLLAGGILVAAEYSLISSGTELSKLDLAGRSLPGKALSRPDLVRQVLRTARDEGVQETYRKVQSRLNEPTVLGYSAAGTVLAVGEAATAFRPGDRVACAGAGIANHAEILSVPRNLAVLVPQPLSTRDAAFAAVGAIALHAFRLSGATVGETVGIVGLGLVGQLAAQVARAAGCRVLGTDVVVERVLLAESIGMQGRLDGADQADHMLVCAASTSDVALSTAIEACRERGRLVVVGDVPIKAAREALYRKELSITVSRSYGPGRYDPVFEVQGHDYPRPYVRWTEQRNLAAFLDLVAEEKVLLEPLVAGEFDATDADAAYSLLKSGGLAVLIRHARSAETPPIQAAERTSMPASAGRNRKPGGNLAVGVIGAGWFARSRLIPALMESPGVEVAGVVTRTGVGAAVVANVLGNARAFESADDLLDSSALDAVVIATRHDTHAALAIKAAQAGCYVYVEKPLALSRDDVATLLDTLDAEQRARVMVGFNRRFAPATALLQEALAGRKGPANVVIRVNAGFVNGDHWTQSAEGGGRLLGEACHFVDLIAALCLSPVRTVFAVAARNAERYSNDNVAAVLGLEDGSVGSLLYTAAGGRQLRKELIEVHWDGQSARIDDFLTPPAGAGAIRRLSGLSRQDKGHREAIRQFIHAAREGSPVPLPFAQAVNSTLATIGLAESFRTGLPYVVTAEDVVAG